MRIEDDVLVTKDGHDVLSDGVPKGVAEIEKLMARAGKVARGPSGSSLKRGQGL